MQSSGTAAAAAVVRCDACGHTAPWRPQFAGRRIKCRCGHVQQVPAQAAVGAGSSVMAPAPQATPAAAKQPAPAPAKQAAPGRRPSPPPQRPAAASALPPLPQAPRQAPPPPPGEEVSFEDVFAQASNDAPADAPRAPGFAADDDPYDLAPDPAAPARLHRAAAAPGAQSAGAYASPDGVGLAASAPVGIPSAVLAYRQVNRRQVEVEKEVSAYGNKQLILPAALIAAGLLLTFVEARLFIGEWNPPAMLVFAAVTTVINLALIFAALLFTARILDLGLGEVTPALLKIAAVAILPAAVSGIIEHGLDRHLSFMAGYVAWFCAVLMYWFFLWLLFEMDFQEVAICTAIIWVIRTWVGMAIFLALFKVLFGTGMPGFDDDGVPDPADARPGMVAPDDWDAGEEDEDDESMSVPEQAPATRPATGPRAGAGAEEEMGEDDEE